MLKHLLDRQFELENLIQELQQRMLFYPKENLCITQNGGYYKYFKSDGHSPTYIPKKEKKIAAELARKKLDSFLLEEYLCELRMIKEFIEKYEKRTKHSEQLQNKCFSGEFVRSKSEVIIANTLFMNHIPYRYECALSLGNKKIYPDFTILHPGTSKIIYWEHFGMMDVPNYCENAFNKLKLYSRHNIIPDINLITTYETQNCPLDSELVQQHISRLLNS